MHALRPELADRRAVGRQLVSRDRLGMDAMVLQQATQRPQSRLAPSLVDQDLENLALVVYRAPELHLLTAAPNEHLIQMPSTGW